MGIYGEVGASTPGGIALSVAGEELARGVQRMGMQARGEHARSGNQADVRARADTEASSLPLAASGGHRNSRHGERPGPGEMDEAVVRHHGDGQVHDEQDGDGLGLLAEREDVDARVTTGQARRATTTRSRSASRSQHTGSARSPW
jgi:hypothetical protein